MSVTVHGPDAATHDAFNGVKGSYEHVMKNIKEFARVKNDDQSISVTLNVMPHTVEKMGDIMVNSFIKLDGQVDAFVVQRIAPSGRAEENPTAYFIEKYQVNEVMKTFKTIKDKIKETLKERNIDNVGKLFGLEVDFCDVFPWCSVAPEYRDMLPEGGCNWGNSVLAVFQDGSIKRCAMSSDVLANMTELDTKEKWNDFWNNNPTLVDFRAANYLDERCKACEMVAKCRGGCLMARSYGDPYKPGENGPIVGHDLLANQDNKECDTYVSCGACGTCGTCGTNANCHVNKEDDEEELCM
jgi:radical SAM protein with 4Fe4S-binding SPASM domain